MKRFFVSLICGSMLAIGSCSITTGIDNQDSYGYIELIDGFVLLGD